jgi:hypothetical protein
LINYSVDGVDPLFHQMLACLLSQPIILGDVTELIVLLNDELDDAEQKVLENRRKHRDREKTDSRNSKSEGSAKSYAWLYSGLDAPREFSLDLGEEHPPPNRPPPDFSQPHWNYAPYNLFHWSLTQEHWVIDEHLKDFRGTFVGDAAGANARLAKRSGDVSARVRHVCRIASGCRRHGHAVAAGDA